MFEKRHYEELADIIAQIIKSSGEFQRRKVINEWASALAKLNPKFDPKKFQDRIYQNLKGGR